MIDVKNLKLFLLGALAVVMISNIGCSKSNNSAPAATDSIRYSNWVTLNMSFAGTDNAGDSVYTQTLKASTITNSILSRSSIVGYLMVADPLNGDTSIVNASLALEEFFRVGNIDLLSFGTDWSGVQYRYVIVPGKIQVTNANGGVVSYSAAQLNKMDYATLTKLLKIPTRGSNFINPNQ